MNKRWLLVKNPPASAGDAGLMPGWGRSPGGGNGNPLQYSCLGNPMDKGAWQAAVHGVAKSQTRLCDSTGATIYAEDTTVNKRDKSLLSVNQLVNGSCESSSEQASQSPWTLVSLLISAMKCSSWFPVCWQAWRLGTEDSLRLGCPIMAQAFSLEGGSTPWLEVIKKN